MEPITGLAWAGARTDRYAETVPFRDVLGLRVAFAGDHQAVFTLPGGALVEVFGPGDPDLRAPDGTVHELTAHPAPGPDRDRGDA